MYAILIADWTFNNEQKAVGNERHLSAYRFFDSIPAAFCYWLETVDVQTIP